MHQIMITKPGEIKLSVLQKWDVGHTAPALSQFLDSGFLNVEGKTAYVPGCG